MQQVARGPLEPGQPAAWPAASTTSSSSAPASLPKSFTDALEPWDLSALTTYDPRFLAGFRAEGYTDPGRRGLWRGARGS